MLFEASRKTWANREGIAGEVFLTSDSFAAQRFIDVRRFADAVVGMNFDGVGTKIEIAERLGDHSTIAFDLVAMVCDDAARFGAEPVLLGSILDFSRISIPVVRQLAAGLVAAAQAARVAVVNGEIAELGSRVAGYTQSSYNWGAGVLWAGRRDRMLSGDAVGPGDAIIAVRERGLRSNGISLVRAACNRAYGDTWHERPLAGSTLGRATLEPSTVYCRLITELTGGLEGAPSARLHGVVHVTGGGVPGKLSRLLSAARPGAGAVLESLHKPPSLMLHCQSLAEISDEEAYQTWNMGNGLLLITPEPDKVLDVAERSGYEAQIAGAITADPGIRIRNEGVGADRTPWLTFSPGTG